MAGEAGGNIEVDNEQNLTKKSVTQYLGDLADQRFPTRFHSNQAPENPQFTNTLRIPELLCRYHETRIRDN